MRSQRHSWRETWPASQHPITFRAPYKSSSYVCRLYDVPPISFERTFQSDGSMLKMRVQPISSTVTASNWHSVFRINSFNSQFESLGQYRIVPWSTKNDRWKKPKGWGTVSVSETFDDGQTQEKRRTKLHYSFPSTDFSSWYNYRLDLKVFLNIWHATDCKKWNNSIKFLFLDKL